MGVLYAVGYDSPPDLLTLEQLEAQTQWRMVHPEVRRRLLALIQASPVINGVYSVGIGGGFRTTAVQTAVFIQRHRRVTHYTALWWDGSYWELIPPYASAAPPLESYHEPTLEGFALAADMIGNLVWADAHCTEFGLINFLAINGESWHLQPAEVPHSRRDYNLSPAEWPLDIWLPAGGGDGMELREIFYVASTDGRQGIWRVGSPIQTFENPTEATKILGAVGIKLDDYLPVSPGTFDRLLNKVQ